MRQVPIFVVSLRRSTQRRAFMQVQMARLGLRFEFIDAADATSDPAVMQRDVDRGACLRNFGREPAPAEIACALSHRRAYMRMAERGVAFAIVMEDDARVLESMHGFLEAIGVLRETFLRDVIHLGALEGSKYREPVLGNRSRIRLQGDLSMRRVVLPDRPLWGAYGYAIGLQAAVSILQDEGRMTNVADAWVWRRWRRTIRELWLVQPAAVLHPATRELSELQESRQKFKAGAKMAPNSSRPVRLARKMSKGFRKVCVAPICRAIG